MLSYGIFKFSTNPIFKALNKLASIKRPINKASVGCLETALCFILKGLIPEAFGAIFYFLLSGSPLKACVDKGLKGIENDDASHSWSLYQNHWLFFTFSKGLYISHPTKPQTPKASPIKPCKLLGRPSFFEASKGLQTEAFRAFFSFGCSEATLSLYWWGFSGYRKFRWLTFVRVYASLPLLPHRRLLPSRKPDKPS